MNIGFDGKRAFQNTTGLGNYSRSLISTLGQNFPAHQYHLFAPRRTSLFDISSSGNITAAFPQRAFYKKFPALWRRFGMVKEIKAAGLDIFHGLSNELPQGVEHSRVKTVVTVHDLIFERFPETYNFEERFVHRWKIKRACTIANAVIAISKQTRDDLVNLYAVPPAKISVCYQACNPVFEHHIPAATKAAVKHRYRLPDKYFLFVSSITPRKNLADVCKAMLLMKNNTGIPLVVIGNGKKEKEAVKKLMALNNMQEKLLLLNELPAASGQSFISAEDFPAIYQQALALVYPSSFEGFGLPVLEAMWSGLPVICSNSSSLPEVAGDAALYFSAGDHAALAKHMMNIASDQRLAETLKINGLQQAKKFTAASHAACVMNVYQRVMAGADPCN